MYMGAFCPHGHRSGKMKQTFQIDGKLPGYNELHQQPWYKSRRIKQNAMDTVMWYARIAGLKPIQGRCVVKVVRCKDCRFCMAFKDKSDGYYGHCRIWITRTISDYAALVDADGYCSYGERKEGEDG